MRPADMQFTTAPGKHCKNCLFEHEHSSLCHEAAKVAVRAGLLDCEFERIIYVLKPADSRQLDIPQGDEK